MYIKDNVVWFYGRIAGEIKEGVAYIQERFQCGEMTCKLTEWGYKIVWERENKY